MTLNFNRFRQTNAVRACRVLCGGGLLILAAGCVTSYHEFHQAGLWPGGYTDTQLAPDRFRVVFEGVGATTYERARDFAMLRACEVTLQAGFTYFTLTEESLPYRNSTDAPATYKRLQIQCFKNKPAGVDSVDATVQRQSLKEKYKLHE